MGLGCAGSQTIRPQERASNSCPTVQQSQGSLLYGGFKEFGALFGSPDSKDRSKLGSILGLSILGNSHIAPSHHLLDWWTAAAWGLNGFGFLVASGAMKAWVNLQPCSLPGLKPRCCCEAWRPLRGVPVRKGSKGKGWRRQVEPVGPGTGRPEVAQAQKAF